MLTSAKEPKSVEAIYIYASEISHYIFSWATVHDISAIKTSKKMLTQQKLLKNYVSHSIIIPISESANEAFQMHICKLL